MGTCQHVSRLRHSSSASRFHLARPKPAACATLLLLQPLHAGWARFTCCTHAPRGPPTSPSVCFPHHVALCSEDQSRELSFTEARRALVGDVNLLRRIWKFLASWQLINFLARRQGAPAGGAGPAGGAQQQVHGVAGVQAERRGLGGRWQVYSCWLGTALLLLLYICAGDARIKRIAACPPPPPDSRAPPGWERQALARCMLRHSAWGWRKARWRH